MAAAVQSWGQSSDRDLNQFNLFTPISTTSLNKSVPIRGSPEYLDMRKSRLWDEKNAFVRIAVIFCDELQRFQQFPLDTILQLGEIHFHGDRAVA